MEEQTALIKCKDCGAKNRVPKGRLRESPRCGKCGTPLQPETIFYKCQNCGAKNRIFKALSQDNPRCGKCHFPLQTLPVYDYVVETNDRTFGNEVISFPGPVLTEFYSNACGYCQMLTPILQGLAPEYAGRLKITKLNIDQNPQTASRFNVMSVPTMILFKEGKAMDILQGAMQKHEIEARLNSHL